MHKYLDILLSSLISAISIKLNFRKIIAFTVYKSVTQPTDVQISEHVEVRPSKGSEYGNVYRPLVKRI